jgi:hypothetical protein
MNLPRRAVTLSRRSKYGSPAKPEWAKRALATLSPSVAILLLLSVARLAGAAAANPDLETVLNGSRQRIEKLDYRVSGRITKVDPTGKRTNYKLLAKAHWFPDGLRLLSVITGPGTDKTSLLVHMTAAGRLTIEARLPGEKASSVVPFEHWNDPVVGTDFSYEDMVEDQFFWKDQELQPAQKFGARDCFVLKSASGAQDRTNYSSVTSWIDRSIMFPVQVVKILRSGQQKQFLYYGLRQTSGTWSASQIEAKSPGKPGSSMLVIEAGTPKANLTRTDFDLGLPAPPAAPAK